MYYWNVYREAISLLYDAHYYFSVRIISLSHTLSFMKCSFQGEEMSIGIRGFTIGYDYYAPERSVCFHHYNIGKNAAARNRVKHFWENGDLYAGCVWNSLQMNNVYQ